MDDKKLETGWICTNCGEKYGSPPYHIHSSWGCENCSPLIRDASHKQRNKQAS